MRKGVLAMTALSVLVGGLCLAPAASAAEVDVSTDCADWAFVTAHAGDTIVFTLSPACSTTGYLWDLNDIPPADTNSGFLHYVSGSPETFGAFDNYANDWYVATSSDGSTTVTTTLQSTDGAGTALTTDAIIGVVSQDALNWYPILFEPASDEPANPKLMWQQANGRASSTASCPDGYTPSWDFWPNGGTGGYVCNRFVPEYGN